VNFRACLVVGVILTGLLMLPASAAWASGHQTLSHLEFVPAEKVPPKEWSDDVCTAIADANSSMEDSLKYLKSDVKSGAPVSEVKAALVDFVAEAVEDTDVLLVDVHDAGVPKMKSGNKLARAIESAITDFRSDLAGAHESLAQASETDPAEFAASASDFEKTTDASGNDFYRTITRAERRYKSPTLDDPACHPEPPLVRP
jgi:hypothetical protein